MAKRYTDEFRRDVVGMATTSGLTRPQRSSDLGVGLATFGQSLTWGRLSPARGGETESPTFIIFGAATIVLYATCYWISKIPPFFSIGEAENS
jgi:hypothetical protein